MDKFIIKRKYNGSVAFKHIHVHLDTYETIKELTELTGYSVVDLIDAMAQFCAERLEVAE